jgi:tRNA(Arg) A34 adenosine deaminase TadA
MQTEHDIRLLKVTLQVAERSLQKGNLPFGCLLADADGVILEEGENTVVTSNDSIAHCEINLVHQLAGKYDAAFLAACSLYASTEPCPMCAAAIFWSGIGRVVYALSKESYHAVVGTNNPAYVFNMPSRELLRHAGRTVEVVGPLLEEEAILFYKQRYHPSHTSSPPST